MPQFALEPYARLKNIVSSLKAAQPAAEGAAPHLVDYVEKLAMGLREHMKQGFTSRLQKSLEQMKWPSKDLQFSEDLLAQWRSNVELLLGLQTPYGLISFQNRIWDILLLTSTRDLQGRDVSTEQPGLEPPILLPLEVMVHPLELRFKYHFSGDKPTNRLDKVWNIKQYG